MIDEAIGKRFRQQFTVVGRRHFLEIQPDELLMAAHDPELGDGRQPLQPDQPVLDTRRIQCAGQCVRGFVGAGHAGCEAALAAARMGCKTLACVINLDTIGAMSCNPAIGGLAKGHLVREIDALGGEMAKNIDETSIQFRRLNTSKGPAVRSSRAQADRLLYRLRMKKILENQENLTIRQTTVDELLVKNNQITGLRTSLDEEIEVKAVVVATGTFLNCRDALTGEEIDQGRSDNQSQESPVWNATLVQLPPASVLRSICPWLPPPTRRVGLMA